jgi:hypothetical protein
LIFNEIYNYCVVQLPGDARSSPLYKSACK